jgi:hypothetical protein
MSASVVGNPLSDVVDGRLEGVLDGRVVGWAWSPGSPLQRIWVTVFVDDEPVGLVPADLERVDLLAAGLGDGAHGFSVELPARLRDGEHHLRVMAGRSNTRLPHASSRTAAVGSAHGSTNGASPVAAEGPEAAGAMDGPAPAPASTLIGSRPPSATIHAGSPLGSLAAASPLRALAAQEWLQRYGPQTVLAVGLLANFLLLLIATRHLGFFHDDFIYILDKRGWSVDTFLTPIYGHLPLMPVATFKLLFLIVGMGHSWPYRFVGATLDTVCVVAVYLLAARHAGRTIALVPAALLLLLGSGTGSTDLVWIASISFLLSLATGAAALLYLDRRDATGDRVATVLLVASIASSGTGLAMCAGALAYLLAQRAPRHRYRVALVPLAIYGVWYLGYGGESVPASNVLLLPDYLVQIAAASFGALAGLSGPASENGAGAVLLAAAIALLCLRARRGQPFPPLAMAGIAGALTFWILAALARAQTNDASNSRYLYVSAVFILIALGGLLSQRRVTARGVALAASLLLLVGLGNLSVLQANVRGRTKLDNQVRVVLGAAEIIGRAGKANFRPDPPKVHYLKLGTYLAAVRQLGSPALTPSQIEGQTEANRQLADRTIIDGERIGLESPPTLAEATAPAVQGSEGVALTTRPQAQSTCLSATPTTSGGSLETTVTPGHSLYLSPGGQGAVAVFARRLAASYPSEPLGVLPAGDGPHGLGFPVDASSLPWHVRLLVTTPLLVCLT